MNSFVPSVRQLRAFTAIYQLGKLSTAAERLYVTPSAVSLLIRQLEDGLGARLFDRTTRSLRPTAAAHELLGTAERVVRDVESIGDRFRALSTLRRGRIVVAITPTLAAFLIPEAVRRFVAAHPEVQLVVDDCAPDQFIARIAGEHVDFGIGTPERPSEEIDARMLMRDYLALVCRRGDALAAAAGRSIRWAELRGVPLITVRPGYGIRSLIDRTAAQAGVVLDVVNEVSFLSTALWMTSSGMGASIMPSAYARASADRALVMRPIAAPRVSRDIAVVVKRGRSLSAASTAFVEVLRAVLDE